MITTEKKIRIFSDTGRGETFEMTKVLYENERLILCDVVSSEREITVLIYKKIGEVLSNELCFYLAENY